MTVIRCESLHIAFEGVVALADLTLQFPRGGIVGIVGPNGAGKTTLLNVLTGFIRPQKGRVWFGSRETTRLHSDRIARLGVARTFQELRLIKQMSLLKNVMLARPQQRGERLLSALFRFGVAADEAANYSEAVRLLDLIGLRKKANDLAGAISFGEQKLLTLACCLATEARVLFLDEPVAGVHPELTRRILEVIREVRQQNRLVVFVEHDLAAVREVADRVIVMDEGAVIADGSPCDILDRPEIMEAYIA